MANAIGCIEGSDKLEKTKVRHNLVGARSLEGLGTLGRLGLEGSSTLGRLGLKGLLLFMYSSLFRGDLYPNTTHTYSEYRVF